MSFQSGITQKQVFEVADRIFSSGQAPTYKSVREELKTGSFTTLANHLTEWKRLKSEESPTPQPPSEFQASALRMWNAAYREAETLFLNEKQVFGMEQQKWKEEKIELLSIIQKLEQEKEIQLLQDHKIQAQVVELNQELQHLRDRFTQLSAQLEGSEVRRVETLQRADRLEAQLTQLASRAEPERLDRTEKGELMKTS